MRLCNTVIIVLLVCYEVIAIGFDSLLEKGNRYLAKGESNEALKYYVRASSFEKRIVDPVKRNELFTNLAIANIGNNAYDAAMESIKRGFQEESYYATIVIGKEVESISHQTARQFYEAAVRHGILHNIWQRPPILFDHSIHSKPFFSPEEFWFTSLLESNYKVIRSELDNALSLLSSDPAWGNAGDRHGNKFDVSLVVGQWRELVFYHHSTPIATTRELCPKTAEIVDKITEATSLWFGQIHFSLLTPGSKLRPHCGPSNYRLTAHLGLIVPQGDVHIRVADEIMGWEEGKVIVFDDSFEHEVWNNTPFHRVVLLLNFWHPSVSDVAKTELHSVATDAGFFDF